MSVTSRTAITIAALTLILAGCGEKTNPPDDGEAVARSAKIGDCSADFVACAKGVLEFTNLLPEEKEQLSGCAFNATQSLGSDPATIEAAKEEIKRTCE